jgi:hypothetical protein
MNRAVPLALPLSAAAVLSLAAVPLVALAVPTTRAPSQGTRDAAVVLADGGSNPCIAAGSQPFKYPACAGD